MLIAPSAPPRAGNLLPGLSALPATIGDHAADVVKVRLAPWRIDRYPSGYPLPSFIGIV